MTDRDICVKNDIEKHFLIKRMNKLKISRVLGDVCAPLSFPEQLGSSLSLRNLSPRDRKSMTTVQDLQERFIKNVEVLGLWKKENGRLKIRESLEIRLKKPKFKTGQEVGALWNGIWHRAKILRWRDRETLEVLMLDGKERVKHKKMSVNNVKRSTSNIHSLKNIMINRFKEPGFNLEENLVVLVSPGGYGHMKGIEVGWEFVQFALEPSSCKKLKNILQCKETKLEWQDVSSNGRAVFKKLLDEERAFTMSFYTRSLSSSEAKQAQEFSLTYENSLSNQRRRKKRDCL